MLLFFNWNNFHLILECCWNDTDNNIAPEETEDEGAGEEEVEDGDSHLPNLERET